MLTTHYPPPVSPSVRPLTHCPHVPTLPTISASIYSALHHIYPSIHPPVYYPTTCSHMHHPAAHHPHAGPLICSIIYVCLPVHHSALVYQPIHLPEFPHIHPSTHLPTHHPSTHSSLPPPRSQPSFLLCSPYTSLPKACSIHHPLPSHLFISSTQRIPFSEPSSTCLNATHLPTLS